MKQDGFLSSGSLGLLEAWASHADSGPCQVAGTWLRESLGGYQSLRPQSCKSLSLDFYGVSRQLGTEACGMPPDGTNPPPCLCPGEPRPGDSLGPMKLGVSAQLHSVITQKLKNAIVVSG